MPSGLRPKPVPLGLGSDFYTYPLHMAVKFNTPLLVYGENINYEYGGEQKEEKPSAKEKIYNGVASGIDIKELLIEDIILKDLNFFNPSKQEEIDNLNPIYLSYFVGWNSYSNYLFAKSRGFHDLTHEWIREGYIENYDQIDSVAYLINPWLKYPKYGFARATDVVGYWIRSGRISKEEGLRLIKENDYKFDQKVLEDFLQFTGYTHKKFWDIVDKFYNKDIFEKIDGQWRLKELI